MTRPITAEINISYLSCDHVNVKHECSNTAENKTFVRSLRCFTESLKYQYGQRQPHRYVANTLSGHISFQT